MKLARQRSWIADKIYHTEVILRDAIIIQTEEGVFLESNARTNNLNNLDIYLYDSLKNNKDRLYKQIRDIIKEQS